MTTPIKIKKLEFSCDFSRLDCWGTVLYDSIEDGNKEGWVVVAGKTCCPSKYCQRARGKQ